MTKRIATILSCAALTGLMACGGAGTSSDKDVMDDMDDMDVNLPLQSPTISSGTVAIADDLLDDIGGNDGWRETPTGQILPFGTATYSGYALSRDLNVSGNSSVDGLYGRVDLRVELLGAGDDVSGTLSDVHTLSGSAPVESLTGELTFDGSADDGQKTMSGTLDGTLAGTFGTGELQEIEVDGTFAGHLADLETEGLFGIRTYDEAAGASGSISGLISGDLVGDFSGEWAAEE